LWTSEEYEGGRHHAIPVDLETFPLFFKAGSITPMGPVMQHTRERPADPITLRVYPGPRAELALYEDDGASYDYEKGKFRLTTLSCEAEGRRVQVGIGASNGRFSGMLRRRAWIVELVSRRAPQSIELDGRELGAAAWSHDGVFVRIPIPRGAGEHRVSVEVQP
jgi:alpha-D-xyloside xylohydrolase